jgi:hypothetical protein
MIDLGLNQNKIKEIKYEVKEGKTVIFKLQNSNLEDVEIIIKSPYDDYSSMPDDEKLRLQKPKDKESVENKSCNCNIATTVFDGNLIDKQYAENEKIIGAKDSGKKEIDLKKLMSETKAKELHDYEPISCLRSEKGMQEALEASRRKRWKKDVIINPSNGTPTGNAIIKIDDNSDVPLKPNEIKNATVGEIMAFNINQKNNDSKSDIEYRDKIEEKLAKDLINSKMLIDDYVYKMSKAEKEAFSKRIKEKYFTDDDKYGEFSKILSLNRLNSTELDENEKRTLGASKKKEWEEDIKNHEINPNNYKIVSLDEKYKDASKEEKEEVSREIIQKDAKIDTDIIKERNKDRAKDEYYKGDPNDEYSKIKSFGDVDVEKTEFIDSLKDKQYISKMPKEYLKELSNNSLIKIGTFKIDRKTDEIIDFKPNDNNKK